MMETSASRFETQEVSLDYYFIYSVKMIYSLAIPVEIMLLTQLLELPFSCKARLDSPQNENENP